MQDKLPKLNLQKTLSSFSHGIRARGKAHLCDILFESLARGKQAKPLIFMGLEKKYLPVKELMFGCVATQPCNYNSFGKCGHHYHLSPTLKGQPVPIRVI